MHVNLIISDINKYYPYPDFFTAMSKVCHLKKFMAQFIYTFILRMQIYMKAIYPYKLSLMHLIKILTLIVMQMRYVKSMMIFIENLNSLFRTIRM